MNEQERRRYELVYIIQPDLDEAGITAINERVVQLVNSQNGEVVKTEVWGKRGLAYPIGKFFDGYFMCHQMSMPPEIIGSIEQNLRYNEDVIRFLTMKVEDE
ncbi:MAG: 30S ribosomal protein S6 [Chloroflexota bacterium]